MPGKAVPSSGSTGPRDFSDAVRANFAHPPVPDAPGSITMQVILSEADAGKITSVDLAAAIAKLLAERGLNGYRVLEVTRGGPSDNTAGVGGHFTRSEQ